jgi:hypothetical protein
MVAGLMAVHAAGVVHRDLKPSNVMIDHDDQVLLMDFGIARANTPSGQQRTIAGAIVGTTAYMAPEQARGEAVDQRTDVYGFGLILYEMLCGIRDNMTIAELVARMKAAPPSARHVNSAVSAELDAIVMRCLKPAAADRYQTSAEVGAALSDFKRRKRGPIPAFALPGWVTRAAAAAAVLALLAGLGYWLKTPGAAKTLAKGREAVAQSLDRLAALSPATLLARETDPTAGVAEKRHVEAASAAAAAEPVVEREQTRSAAAGPGQSQAARTAPSVPVQFERPASVASAMPPMQVNNAPLHARFDDVRGHVRLLPAAAAMPSRPQEHHAPAAVRSFVPWNEPGRAASSPWIASARPSRVTLEDTPAATSRVARTPRTASTPASGSWLDRLLSGKGGASVERYADAFEEFQVCHVPN